MASAANRSARASSDVTQLPLHLQVLVHLRDHTTARKEQLEIRCGKGLPDQDYQRHVGRIAECENHLEVIADMMKTGLSEVEDTEEERSEQSGQARRRTKARNRATQ